MIFITESGSAYEIKGNKIQRVNLSNPKRADNEWLELMSIPTVSLGSSVVLHLQSLAEYGPDDHGNHLEDHGAVGGVTIRRTSPVVKIYGNIEFPLEDTGDSSE